MKNLVVVVGCVLVLSQCSSNAQKQSDTFIPELNKGEYSELVKQVDQIVTSKKNMKVFGKDYNGIYSEIKDTINWPDSLDLVYNLFYDQGQLRLMKEVPISESGDNNCVYNYYYDKDGRVRVVIDAISTFGNDDSIIHLKKTYCYNQHFIKEYSDSAITDLNGKALSFKDNLSYFEGLESKNHYKTINDLPHLFIDSLKRE